MRQIDALEVPQIEDFSPATALGTGSSRVVRPYPFHIGTERYKLSFSKVLQRTFNGRTC